ncbi:leucine-rich repeat extensin-like protein 3 [Oryza brachyantha]|uniref:leucine-rich repeat extensin-like protein 3 n=1 Tax=Oryza brachyantha TaxID=4533 RepID=UPI001AD97F57|nr:leucine-rich repeat extensin-like protein 3 [Oryza brachyantha]
MEHRSHLAVLLGLLAFAAGVPAAAAAAEGTQLAAGTTTAEASCEPSVLATQVSLFCAPDMPTAQCCEPVVASVDLGGGVPCLCRVAAEPQLIISGLNATHLLTLYAACGGLRQGGPRLAAACEAPAPSASVINAPPPPAALRRKPPAREAPPPPSPTDKLPPPPQQHDDSDHNKRDDPNRWSPRPPLTPPPPPPPPTGPTAAPSPPWSGASLQGPLAAATTVLATTLLIAAAQY